MLTLPTICDSTEATAKAEIHMAHLELADGSTMTAESEVD